MSAVAALRAGIEATDFAIEQHRKRGFHARDLLPKPAKAPRSAQEQTVAEIAKVAKAAASLYPPLGALAALASGGPNAWSEFRDTALSAIAGKTDKDVSAAEFAQLATRFVEARAALAKSGIPMPQVYLPPLQGVTSIPLWVYGIAVAAAIAGVVLWKL